METRFTPGPWRVGYDGTVCASDYRSTGICSMLGTLRNKSVKADALLIAAAPEMYEALREAREHLRVDGSRKMGRRIDELLAKARGDTET